jgi:iron complex transport system ATP-binding protein
MSLAKSTALVQIRGAAFSYGERPIFESLDLDVYAGEVLTVLGTNGCGKSTLLRCIGGALSLTRGTVRIGDAELGALDASARARKVGFLFQDHTPSFPFTVLDVATMGRTPYLSTFGVPSRADVALAEQALDTLSIGHLRDRPYTELSGGERQLVLLSRTLVQQPEVILLDEPTSHLDFANQVRCLKAIGFLATQGVAMIMTTHDPNHASVFSGRVVLMKREAPIIVGSGAEVLTEGLLSEVYGIDVGVFSLPRRASAGEIRFCSPW